MAWDRSIENWQQFKAKTKHDTDEGFTLINLTIWAASDAAPTLLNFALALMEPDERHSPLSPAHKHKREIGR
jgi:hypothetical protein